MFSEGAFRSLIRSSFSYLVLNRDQSGSDVGTGFSLDLNNDKTQANFNFAWLNHHATSDEIYPKAKNIWSLGFQAGYANGVGNLFSNTKANGKAGGTVKWSHLLNSGTGALPEPGACENIIQSSRNFIDLAVSGYYTKAYQKVVTKYRDSLAYFDSRITYLRTQVTGPAKKDTAFMLSIYKEMNDLETRQKSTIAILADSAVQDTVIRRIYDSLVTFELKANDKWRRMIITWYDVSASANAAGYTIYDDKTAFINQSISKGLSTLSIGFNQLRNWKNFLWYWRLGYQNSNATNLDLAKTYTQEQSTSNSTGAQQNKVYQNATVYKLSETGAFELFRQHTFQGETIFMFAKNSVGLDLFCDLGFAYNSSTYTKTGIFNAGMGIILTAQDMANNKAKVNVELFYKLTDINNQLPSSKNYNTWERYNFGLKVGLPFNKVLL